MEDQKSTSAVFLEFSCGPGAAGVKGKGVQAALGALKSHNLIEDSDGIVTRTNGDLIVVANAVRKAIIDAFQNGATHFRAVIRQPEDSSVEGDELLESLQQVARSLSGEIIPASMMMPRDIPLEFKGHLIGGIKELSPKGSTAIEGVNAQLIEGAKTQFGELLGLQSKQRREIISWLERHHAFERRRAVEVLAVEMQVSRATIYNDLKVIRGTSKA